MSSPTLSPIYDRLHGTNTYHPFTANTFADWSSEAGDTVTITRGGEDYVAPIHKQTISWGGQQRITMQTGGNKEREATERVSDRKFRSTKSSARTSSGKTHTFEVNDAHLLYEIDNPTTGIKTRLQVAENDITAEVTRATQAEGEIQQDISSLEITINGITQTVGTIETEVTTLDGKVTTIEGSALWTQRDNITGVVGEFDVVEDSSHKKTLVVKSGGGLSIRRNGVAFGVYDDGTLTAGVIATKVNGVASTNIYADKILMSSASGAPTVQVTVNGKLDATEFTAANINSLFSGAVGFNALSGDFTFLGADYLTVSEGTSAGTLSATSFSLANSNPFTDCIVNADVNSTTGVLTLTKASGGTVTFSKATTLTGAWSGGVFTATASPQGTTLTTSTTVGATTWAGNVATVPIKATIGSGTTFYDVRTVTVNAQTIFDNGYGSAHVSGEFGTGDNKNKFTAKKVNTGSTDEVSCTVTSSIDYDSTTHKYTANALGNQSIKHSTESGTEAYLAGLSEGIETGYAAGWDAAAALVTRTNNIIKAPVVGGSATSAVANKFIATFNAATYTASSYTAETHSYTASKYTASSHSYTASTYTASSHSHTASTYTASANYYTPSTYTASKHSHSGAYVIVNGTTYTKSSSIPLTNFTGTVRFSPGSDSYTASTYSASGDIYYPSSYTAETDSYTASSYKKETDSYKASSYTKETHSYTASVYSPSAFKQGSLTWTDL